MRFTIVPQKRYCSRETITPVRPEVLIFPKVAQAVLARFAQPAGVNGVTIPLVGTIVLTLNVGQNLSPFETRS